MDADTIMIIREQPYVKLFLSIIKMKGQTKKTKETKMAKEMDKDASKVKD